MSKENVKLFYTELAKNEALKTKFKVINGSFDQNSTEEQLDGILDSKIIPIAKEAGYEFTLSELKEYAREITSSPLSDDELEAVAGGVDCGCVIGGYASGEGGKCVCGLAGGGSAPDDGDDEYCSCFLAGIG